jgi:ABC-type spermidine/putrescine transport system permease subunit II
MWASRWSTLVGRRLIQLYAIAAAVVLAYPTVQLFIVAVSDDIVFPPRYFSLDAFRLERLPTLLETMPFSIALGVVTTVVLLALAIPTAYATERLRFRGRALASAAIFLPVIIPGVGYMVALGTAYILVFPSLIGSFTGVLLPTVIFNLVWTVRAIQSSLSVTDPAYEDAALMLGASRVRAFFTVTLPAIAPGIAVGAMITFANATTAFTAPFFLGRTTALTTTVGIFNELSRFSLTPRLAAESLVVELIVMAFVLAAYLVARKRFRGLII